MNQKVRFVSQRSLPRCLEFEDRDSNWMEGCVEPQHSRLCLVRSLEPLAQAYCLKDELRLFWQQPSKTAATKFLDDWCRRAEATGIRVRRTMSHALRGHRVGSLNWYDHPISTSPLEGTNNKIGLLQRRAYGDRR